MNLRLEWRDVFSQSTDTLDDYANYFVTGNLLCTRWRNAGGDAENREWWEVTINGDTMNWTALREDENGQRYTATFEMNRVF